MYLLEDQIFEDGIVTVDGLPKASGDGCYLPAGVEVSVLLTDPVQGYWCQWPTRQEMEVNELPRGVTCYGWVPFEQLGQYAPQIESPLMRLEAVFGG